MNTLHETMPRGLLRFVGRLAHAPAWARRAVGLHHGRHAPRRDDSLARAYPAERRRSGAGWMGSVTSTAAGKRGMGGAGGQGSAGHGGAGGSAPAGVRDGGVPSAGSRPDSGTSSRLWRPRGTCGCDGGAKKPAPVCQFDNQWLARAMSRRHLRARVQDVSTCGSGQVCAQGYCQVYPAAAAYDDARRRPVSTGPVTRGARRRRVRRCRPLRRRRVPARRRAAPQCVASSECATGRACTNAVCRTPCAADADCCASRRAPTAGPVCASRARGGAAVSDRSTVGRVRRIDAVLVGHAARLTHRRALSSTLPSRPKATKAGARQLVPFHQSPRRRRRPRRGVQRRWRGHRVDRQVRKRRPGGPCSVSDGRSSRAPPGTPQQPSSTRPARK
jgi:hypothetical protein